MTRQDDKTLQVHMTVEEWNELERQTKAKMKELRLTRLSISEYVRHLIAEKAMKEE